MCLIIVTGHLCLAAEMTPAPVGAGVAGARSPDPRNRAYLYGWRPGWHWADSYERGSIPLGWRRSTLLQSFVDCWVKPGHKPGQQLAAEPDRPTN